MTSALSGIANTNQPKEMAARKTLTLSDAWREKIQTSMLINRLQDHIEGKVELSTTQVTAALGLLKKTAPDLSATTLSGDADNPLVVSNGLRETLGTKLDRIVNAGSAPEAKDRLN